MNGVMSCIVWCHVAGIEAALLTACVFRIDDPPTNSTLSSRKYSHRRQTFPIGSDQRPPPTPNRMAFEGDARRGRGTNKGLATTTATQRPRRSTCHRFNMLIPPCKQHYSIEQSSARLGFPLHFLISVYSYITICRPGSARMVSYNTSSLFSNG